MAEQGHTFGPACAFYRDEEDETTQEDNNDNPPAVKAQFFYISALPIDDPLSPLPPIPTAKIPDVPPQPFSVRDNAALEEAWQDSRNNQGNSKLPSRPGSRGLNRMFSFPRFQRGLKSPEPTSPITESSSHGLIASQADRSRLSGLPDVSSRSLNSSPVVRPVRQKRSASTRSNGLPRRPDAEVDTPAMLEDLQDEAQMDTLAGAPEQRSPESAQESTRHPRKRSQQSSRDVTPENFPAQPGSSTVMVESSLPTESSLTGRPFARAPSSKELPTSSTADFAQPPSPPLANGTSLRPSSSREPGSPSREAGADKLNVPVGVSKLHLVEFPNMQMKPIYWNPVNDVSPVIRATWFYKDSMLPVPAAVANRLEIGYEDLKPYSPTYQDELSACIANGAVAEMKVVHKLWPDEGKKLKPSEVPVQNDDELKEDDGGEWEVLPEAIENAAADRRRPDARRRLFDSYSVVYVNRNEAQILRPSALPSAIRNRKPLDSIRRGRQLGIAVVRGFDRRTWHKLHPNKSTEDQLAQARFGALMAQSGNAAIRGRPTTCPKCDENEHKPKVSDLVLVIHGIGQKLSERVDSYHFTHAMNGLRRSFNVELTAENVKSGLKKDTGIMVLPINWRLTVNLEDEQQMAQNKYELKDITPESLPAVRSLISDVMLDIPYYLSHHRARMIASVIREANRVYRLWCRNNPGFRDSGRVHLVAHSLGSVMAMEILSNQPTYVPKDLDLTSTVVNEQMFEFDTGSLFCCGSPSGFFLLLHGANLVPRKGRNKSGMEGEDGARGVGAEAGTYGCLAVDNIYNICHRNDPVAYQQNACVDSDYAASIQPAAIPSATQSLFYRLSGGFRWTSAKTHDAYGAVETVSRPSVAHMPSTVELETHDFSREEIAEKRMFLLNDNGQIDYFLSSGGGPLEIQYLNMLSAHSSYWYLQDFVRFLVVEIGRKPGKTNTLPALRAVKKREFKRGTLG